MPPLSREVDALWQVICPSYYLFFPLSVRPIPKVTKHTLKRCFRSLPQRNIPETGHSGTKTLPRHEKTDSLLKNSEDFFFSSHHVEIDASSQAIAPARGLRKSRDVSEEYNRRSRWERLTQSTKLQGPGSLRSSHNSSRDELLYGNERHANPGVFLERSPNPISRPHSLNLEVRGFKVRQGRWYGELNEEELYEELRRTSTAGDYPRLREILRILIEDRGEKPNRRHYQASLLVNVSPQHGSAADIARILLEMEEAGITLDSAAYHAALKVRTQGTATSILANARRSSLSTLTIFSGGRSWKKSVNDGLHFPARAGTTSLPDSCETSKLNPLSQPFRAPSR